ncbi:MAG: J domain-containing protein, partial [Pseudomonadota bacterium]|nr:J domain-containing protein [Pseudomonadota bacterium]
MPASDGQITSRKDPKGYYATLGLSPDASGSELKQAFRRLALTYHPDRNPEASAKARFQKINEAW